MPSQNHRVMTALDIRTEREERPTRLCTVLLTQETRVPGGPACSCTVYTDRGVHLHGHRETTTGGLVSR